MAVQEVKWDFEAFKVYSGTISVSWDDIAEIDTYYSGSWKEHVTPERAFQLEFLVNLLPENRPEEFWPNCPVCDTAQGITAKYYRDSFSETLISLTCDHCDWFWIVDEDDTEDIRNHFNGFDSKNS